MKKTILFFLISTISCFSQTKAEIDLIKKSYDINRINQLNENILSLKNLREEKIRNYLDSNLAAKREYVANGTKYLLIDVIDNKPVYTATDNRLSAMASKTNTLYPGGNLGLSLTGLGMKVGIWDGGYALKNHQEFMNGTVSRVTTPDTSTPIPAADQHASHVVGTVGAKGVATSARGMAYEANLASYNWTNDESEVSSEAANNGLLISNHSYGVPIFNDNGDQQVGDWYMGCYNTDAAQWDQISYTLPYYLTVMSAGNSGNESYSNGLYPGIDKLTGEKNSKNNLVVANANPTVNQFNGTLTNLVINSSSSQGPSDDGRIKPDIAADGTNLYSSSNETTTSYATLSGTSMASPSVAGSLILLQQHYNNLHASYMKSATLKGLVCHTAFDDSNSIGPDVRFGWGLLNTRESALAITNANSATPTAIVSELNLDQSSTYTVNVIVTNPQTLKATICWTDVPGTPKNNQLNSPSPALINDLDLRIIKDTEVSLPWKLDLNSINSGAIKGDNTVDNVEKVEVENAVGTYTIQVTHKGTLDGGFQNYSLIVSGFDQVDLANNDFSREQILVYPNPVNDLLHVTNANNITKYQLFDIQGRLIKSEKLTNQSNFTIDTSMLIKGVYMLNLITENGSFVEKIVKK
ncbi:S8 family serine peptidase [Flavobacterium sp. AS60]|uniref:S8 family serine peptidase n=1 Tax=Flavobacterium anseongense TaxID=2910677 RepID=UPI001F435A05|nr:S8 family serine peptidase [Flavobacterium sp. AS60]MCF6128225.1 S8 family serine peptidase [Flavobacterium sp. AS60]